MAETIIDCLTPRFPGIAEQIEVIDVATPLTSERFTGSWQSLQAWPPAGKFFFKGFTKILPGLGNFHMVGQWAGVPSVSRPWRSWGGT